MPFKERALSLADHTGDVAQMVGATDALRREPDGRWTGDMFDGIGLMRALEDGGAEPAGRRVILPGAGGAGSATAVSLAFRGAAEIAVRDRGRAERPGETVGAAPLCHRPIRRRSWSTPRGRDAPRSQAAP